MPKEKVTDFYSSYGAGVLAKKIEDYWKARGYGRIKVTRYELFPGTFALCSNIGPTGYPPR